MIIYYDDARFEEEKIDTILAKQSRWMFLLFPFYFPEKRLSRLLCEYCIYTSNKMS